MTSDVQGQDPVDALLDVASTVVPAWLGRITLAAAAEGGVGLDPDDEELATMVAATSRRLVAELVALIRSDVDEQRTNPLSLFRAAVAAPTALLQARGVAPPPVDGFQRERFPGDVYGIGPATWSDVHPDLHEPGLIWGAWKAGTVLRRRREEGLR